MARTIVNLADTHSIIPKECQNCYNGYAYEIFFSICNYAPTGCPLPRPRLLGPDMGCYIPCTDFGSPPVSPAEFYPSSLVGSCNVLPFSLLQHAYPLILNPDLVLKEQSKGLRDYELFIQESKFRISRAASCPMQWESPVIVTGGSQVRVAIVLVILMILKQSNSSRVISLMQTHCPER